MLYGLSITSLYIVKAQLIFYDSKANKISTFYN